jgi:hypothetical protein
MTRRAIDAAMPVADELEDIVQVTFFGNLKLLAWSVQDWLIQILKRPGLHGGDRWSAEFQDVTNDILKGPNAGARSRSGRGDLETSYFADRHHHTIGANRREQPIKTTDIGSAAPGIAAPQCAEGERQGSEGRAGAGRNREEGSSD